MPSKERGIYSKREWDKMNASDRGKRAKERHEERMKKRMMQRKALKKVYKSGFDKYGDRIDFSDPKTKRGIITSID